MQFNVYACMNGTVSANAMWFRVNTCYCVGVLPSWNRVHSYSAVYGSSQIITANCLLSLVVLNC